MKEEELFCGYANMEPPPHTAVSITMDRAQSLRVALFVLWYLVRHPRSSYIKISLMDDVRG